jgi:hypothetical protein
MLTSAPGALVKGTKNENFKIKVTFFYIFEELTTQTPM